MARLRNVVVVGAGPAGLYAATLVKRQQPGARVTVFERNPPDATFGFGVVFSEQALAFLDKDDPETAAAVAPHMQNWRDMTLSVRGRQIVVDGIGFSAIGRLTLLTLLRERAAAAGVELRYDTEIETIEAINADLVVGADGVNSRVRDSRAEAFVPERSAFQNRFAWFGTTKPYPTLTQTFLDSEWGPFNAHHYRYQPDMSTFIVECGPATWQAAGFADLDEDAARRRCEAVFAETLDGHPLIANRSLWRQFPRLWCRRWVDGNRVLIGDTAHTAHFSIGSGTRLAMEDALALAAALRDHADLAAALAAFEAARQPIARKIVAAASASGAWYEDFGAHMRLPPLDFALSYITRSGRIEPDRLRRLAPRFAARYEAERGRLGSP